MQTTTHTVHYPDTRASEQTNYSDALVFCPRHSVGPQTTDILLCPDCHLAETECQHYAIATLGGYKRQCLDCGEVFEAGNDAQYFADGPHVGVLSLLWQWLKA